VSLKTGQPDTVQNGIHESPTHSFAEKGEKKREREAVRFE
jgi:hypothetical protein